MSHFTASMIESVANRLTKEARILRQKAEAHPNESIRHFLLRRSWSLTGAARAMLEEIGQLP